MKTIRLFVMLALALACTCPAFAQRNDATPPSGDVFVVHAIVGKVEREASAGTWEPVVKGMRLDGTVTVSTGLNSRLVLKRGERTIVIDAMKKGSLADLVARTGPDKAGVRIGGKAVKSDASDAGPERTNVPTASTRASESAGDVLWEE